MQEGNPDEKVHAMPSAVDPRFGQRMKQLRAEQDMSLQDLARTTLSSTSHLQRIEAGTRPCPLDLGWRIDTALAAGGDLVALLPGGQPPVHAGPWTPSDTAKTVSTYTREDLAIDRRTAVRPTGMVVGTTLLEAVERWLVDEAEPPVERARSRFGVEEVAQVEAAAQLFRAWDNQFGGGLRRKAVVGQLSEVADELRDFHHPEPLRVRLFGVMAHLASTAATMSWDSGLAAEAQAYYMMALRAAKQAGDRAFAANVLAGMARQLLYMGRASEALELVRLAQDGADGHATPRVRAMLRTREAWAHAAQGRLAAFSRLTSRAEDALRDATDDDPWWIMYFGEAELHGVTGGRLLELTQRADDATKRRDLAEKSATHIDQAVRLRPGQSLRSQALDRIGFAEARLLQDEPEEAVRLGREALAVAVQTPSHRVRLQLEEFYQKTAARADVRAVAGLRAELREVLTA